jgi:hypothetical protein
MRTRAKNEKITQKNRWKWRRISEETGEADESGGGYRQEN